MYKKRISFYTLGCRLNQSETAVLKRIFDVDNKYAIVEKNKDADIAVINTCTVTKNGDADTLKLVNKISRTNKNTKIALIGCQAQIQKDKLTELPNVNWVIGNEHKLNLYSIIEESHKNITPKIVTSDNKEEYFSIPMPGLYTNHTRANIKIQDGCDSFCSYCEIPYARGRAKSRVFEDILREAQALVECGHKELVITGINVGKYKYKNKSFVDVINALEQITNLTRIRISSIEPTTIEPDLLKKMSGRTKLCRFLHIPLQSANDYILKLMNRKYNFEEFNNLLSEIKKTIPNICIGTDVISGFPGEDDKIFMDSFNKLKNLPFNYMHVFSYSKRNMAKSKNFGNINKQEIIQKRTKKLCELSKKKRLEFYESLIGTSQNVLFEQEKNGYWTGLTDNYARVKVLSNENINNKYYEVKIIEPVANGIFGKMLK